MVAKGEDHKHYAANTCGGHERLAIVDTEHPALTVIGDAVGAEAQKEY